MIAEWHLTELIKLVRQRFPDWDGFEHPPFVDDELTYKYATIQKARELISKGETKRLLEQAAYDTFIERLIKLGRDNNLLWTAQPRRGDLAILHQPNLPKWEFCEQMRALLYDRRPSPDKLLQFSNYCEANNLPNKWSFATYFLFITRPHAEMFIKPSVAKWFMQFMGMGELYTTTPNADMYERYKKNCHGLMGELGEYGAKDMVHIQSLIWVAYRESQKRTGGLNLEAQLELDRPDDLEDEEESYDLQYEISQEDLEVVREPAMNLAIGYFSEQSFDLLKALHDNPTKSFYQSKITEFKQYIEVPFKELFQAVAKRLPEEIKKDLETKRRLFSRIPKNDYGQGGTWDFYWGAFYIKDSKRIASPQLSMWINYQFLEFGFYIGEYGSKERQRFKINAQKFFGELSNLLSDVLANPNIVYGKRESFVVTTDKVFHKNNISGKQWLQDVENEDFDASYVLTKNQLLRLNKEDLIQLVINTYKALFPFILIAIYNDPLQFIKDYLGMQSKNERGNISEQNMVIAPYSLETMTAETGYPAAAIQEWVDALNRKGQVVFYGPPGTGKTYLAHKLAQHLVSGGDGFIELVQFHPAYDYTDFIEGIRPQTHQGALTYELHNGRFVAFCKRARSRQDICVLIIDELNRANLARVFGELMYLLEYRDQHIHLASGTLFTIPHNVRLIGTMNTADRSIALVDHALRRRFAFIPLWPNFDSLRHYHAQTGLQIEPLIHLLTQLNQRIGDRHYEIGTSFFMRPDLPATLPAIWQLEIEPYLEEYFFNQPERLNDYRWEKIKERLRPLLNP